MSIERIVVDLGDRSYPVIVGHGAITFLAELIGPTAQRCAIVTQEGIPNNFSVPIAHKRFII